MITRRVFECLDCGGTSFFQLVNLALKPENEQDIISTNVFVCKQCDRKYRFLDSFWSRIS